jgi:hypothetical protein
VGDNRPFYSSLDHPELPVKTQAARPGVSIYYDIKSFEHYIHYKVQPQSQ